MGIHSADRFIVKHCSEQRRAVDSKDAWSGVHALGGTLGHFRASLAHIHAHGRGAPGVVHAALKGVTGPTDARRRSRSARSQDLAPFTKGG